MVDLLSSGSPVSAGTTTGRHAGRRSGYAPLTATRPAPTRGAEARPPSRSR